MEDQDKVNVKDTMAIVREEVKDAGQLEEPSLYWLDGPVYWKIDLDRPLICVRPFLGPIIIFLKRIIRKTVRWYVKELADQMERKINNLSNKLMQAEAQIKQLSVQIASAKREQSETKEADSDVIKEDPKGSRKGSGGSHK